jgi:hypothetical protein
MLLKTVILLPFVLKALATMSSATIPTCTT